MTDITLPASGLDPSLDTQTIELSAADIARYASRLAVSFNVEIDGNAILAPTPAQTWALLDIQLRNASSPVSIDDAREMIETLAAEEQRLGVIARGEHLTEFDAPDAAGFAAPATQLVDPLLLPEVRDEIARLEGTGLSRRVATSQALENYHAGLAGPAEERRAQRKAESIKSAGALGQAEAAAVLRARGDLPEDFNVVSLALAEGFDEARALAEEQAGTAWSQELADALRTEAAGPTAQAPGAALGQAAKGAAGGQPLPPEEAGTEFEPEPLIGVAPGFSVRKPPEFPLPSVLQRRGIDRPDFRLQTGGGFTGIQQDTFRAQYSESDAANFWVGLGTEQVAAYQRMFIRAGLMTKEQQQSEFGIPGFNTDAALLSLMGWSNAHPDLGDLFDALDLLTEANRAGLEAAKDDEPIPVWVPSVYVAPDPDTLAQTVKATYRQRLGRDPTPAELREMVGAFGPEFRKQFDAEEAALRSEFERQVEAAKVSELGVRSDAEEAALASDRAAFGVPLEGAEASFGADPGAAFAELPGAPSVQGTDPQASFQEAFEARYAKEFALIDRQAEARSARDSLLASLGVIDRAVG